MRIFGVDPSGCPDLTKSLLANPITLDELLNSAAACTTVGDYERAEQYLRCAQAMIDVETHQAAQFERFDKIKRKLANP